MNYIDLYQQIFFSTIAVSFGILHLILYLYNKQLKGNLYFSIFLFLFALNIFFDFQSGMADSREGGLLLLRIHRAVMPYNVIFMLLFFYSVFNIKIPKHYWILVASIVITGFVSVLEPIEYFHFVQYAQIAVLIEVFRILIGAVRSKHEDAWILGAGFSLLFLFSAYDSLLDFRLLNPVYNIHNGYPMGFFGLIIFSSIYLAREFARANRTIIEQEKKSREMELSRKLLEAEDRRKSKELEEARNLQLSMLPNCTNNIPGYDICFFMKTSTEVGGDYYDYQYSKDKQLTIAIGDATGHGMKAGTMVSVVKGLFIAEGADTEQAEFLKKASTTINKMNLSNLFMSLALIRIKDRKMTVASAGMPPVIIYRQESKSLSEIKIKALPLGGPALFPYESENASLASGDVILLMSDGFPELFNSKDEMLDYPRIKDIFLSAIDGSANQIVERLMKTADEWRGERPQDDDITFVVVKIL